MQEQHEWHEQNAKLQTKRDMLRPGVMYGTLCNSCQTAGLAPPDDMIARCGPLDPLSSNLKHSLVTSASSLSLHNHALPTSFQSTRHNAMH